MFAPKMNANLNVPLSSALFTVDSRDGIKTDPATGFVVNSTNPYNIQIYKNQQLFSGAVQRIALAEINMPFNIPNVNPYNNILFLENESGEVFVVGKDKTVDGLGAEISTDIDIGFYKPDELAELLTAVLNNASVFGTNTWLVKYTVDGPITDAGQPVVSYFPYFSITNSTVNFRVNPMLGKQKPNYISDELTEPSVIVPRSSTLAEMMGFANASTLYTKAQRGRYASMLYTNYVDIVSPVLSKHMEVRDTGSSYFTGYDILARIYIAREGYDNNVVVDTSGENPVITTNILGTRPFHLHYNFPVPKQIKWSPNEFLPSCNIQLRDMFGNILYNQPTNLTSTLGLFSYAGSNDWVEMNFLISEIN
jgi:hypothetical protein